MKNIKKAILALFFLQSGLYSMDKPDGWKPSRPSWAGRQRPTAVYGGQPVDAAADDQSSDITNPKKYTNPIYNQAITITPRVSSNAVTEEKAIPNEYDKELSFYMNAGKTIHPSSGSGDDNSSSSSSKIKPPKAHAEISQPISSLTPTKKERKAIEKINEDLEKIDENLKEMGWNFVEAAGAAASLNPLGAGSALFGIGRALYIAGLLTHIAYQSSKLTKGSPEALAIHNRILPRLAKLKRGLNTASSTVAKPVNFAISKVQAVFSK